MCPPYPRVWLGDRNIVHVEFAPHSQISLQKIQQACKKRLELVDKPSPLLILAKNVSGYDIDATLYLSNQAVKSANTAYAIVTDTFLSDFIAREFVKYHKPPCPVQVFAQQQAAIEWLSEFIE